VVWPSGRFVTEEVRLADRLASLSGKRVAFVWDYMFQGDQAFDLIAEEMRHRHPGIDFISYREFGNIHGADEAGIVAALPELLARTGAHAAVVGIGH
jgi:hypothetical protein